VFDRTAATRMPSDLAGITAATYVPPSSGTLVSALGAVASKIRRAAEGIASRQAIVPVRTSNGCSISVHFGRLEELADKDERSLVLLPANEFFDDDCVADSRSALGTFIAAHCRSGSSGFQSRLKAALALRSSTMVEKERGLEAASYGVGATLFLNRSEELPFNIAVAAVTTKRAGQGLNGSPENILRALTSVVEVAADNRLSRLWVPLICSGHGGVVGCGALRSTTSGVSGLV
jgi:hypothetical protein